MSYSAIICKANVRPHPNADKLVLLDCHSYQIVAGIDTQDGDLGIMFPCDGKLSDEMCAYNDLIGYTDSVTGERKGGFFSKNKRIRAQKFRGERSEGFWMPISSLAWCGDLSHLKEGDLITEINGKLVCEKYFTPATMKQMSGVKKVRKNNPRFHKHVDTSQYKHVNDMILEGSIIYITFKCHGTSARVGYLQDEVIKKSWIDKLLRRPGKNVLEWKHIHGTRNVVLDDPEKIGFHGSEAFRFKATETLQAGLKKGEVAYVELVGYTTDGGLIMGAQDTTKLNDKSISKQYGSSMEYKYGCLPGETKMFVYRITQVNEDGDAIDLSWPQVKRRCREMFVDYVPEADGPILHEPDDDLSATERLDSYVADHTDGPDPIDPSHIREGIVLRVERPDGHVEFIKSKSFLFYLLEGIAKEQDDFVDTEEIA